MGTLLFALINFLRAAFRSRSSLALENAALRQQLAAYQRAHRRPRLRARDRLFWVFLREAWSGWSRPLIIVKPDTVIGWHRQGFRLLWQRKSRSAKLGRRRIPREHINFIRRTSRDHPEWGEDEIAEEFGAKFGIQHSPSTIRRYMTGREVPPHGKQTWRTFIRNHANQVWACDFLTQYTAFFAVVHVFVIWRLDPARRVVHANVTTNPTLSWVKQQIREATADGQTPLFLVHDNDRIIRQLGRTTADGEILRGRRYRYHVDRWLQEVIGVEGLTTPYGAPNASPHIERFMRTLRWEALDHFIFLGAEHVRRVVTEYVCYYSGARPSQGALTARHSELRGSASIPRISPRSGPGRCFGA